MNIVAYGIILPIVLLIAAGVIGILIAMAFRRVVPQNEVHSVQSKKSTISYGKGLEAGNTYYAIPSWVPHYGVVSTVLPVSNFSINLTNYEAYDKGRLPFALDISAFFRIDDPNLAAQRVSSMSELTRQLENILQGAARTILAKNEIEQILEGRGEFGDAFTAEVKDQLANWGVVPVKNIEMMDLRDANGSQVIRNIMEKKKSVIERESRVEVAENMKQAEIAEIQASREAEIQKQQALQAVGVRTAEKEREVGIAREKSAQLIAEQNKVTQEKNVQVQKVQEVGRAEIAKETHIIAAEEKKQTDVIKAEGEKAKQILAAEAQLETERRIAEGVQVNGVAKAEAERLFLLAPVEAQITLAKEIGENNGYQQYLLTIEQIKATQAVGIEQAQALKSADLKVIANAGTVDSGVSSIGSIFTSAGGQGIASLLEGLAQTEAGSALVKKLVK